MPFLCIATNIPLLKTSGATQEPEKYHIFMHNISQMGRTSKSSRFEFCSSNLKEEMASPRLSDLAPNDDGLREEVRVGKKRKIHACNVPPVKTAITENNGAREEKE